MPSPFALTGVYIVAAARTPFGRFNNCAAWSLAQNAVSYLPAFGIHCNVIESVVYGSISPHRSHYENEATKLALSSCIPPDVSCYDVSARCMTGMQALMCGVQDILSDQSGIALCVGADMLTGEAPYRLGSGKLETIAKRFNLTQNDFDGYANMSRLRLNMAQQGGMLSSQVLQQYGNTDQFADKSNSFLITGGNSMITINNVAATADGAAQVVLANAEKTQAYGLKPIARIVNYAQGCGLSSAAIKKLLDEKKWTAEKIDLFEIHEATAVHVMVACKELGVDVNTKVNLWGGALAFGHPPAASGLQLIGNLCHQMTALNKNYGIAAISTFEGLSSAILLQNCYGTVL